MNIILKAQQQPLETLFVAIEGDVSGLLDDVADGVKKSSDELEKLGDAAKKTSKTTVDSAGRMRDEFGRFIKQSDEGGPKIKGFGIKAGAAFGLAAGAAGALLNVVINLITSTFQLFQNLTSQAIQLASNFEQAKLTFTNIFKDEGQATKFLADLRGEATRLGISFDDAAQFAKSIFPDTKNAEEFNRILKNAAIGAADAGLPLRELIFSFNEAVAGDFVSIRDRLDIPKDVIERIKASPDIVSALNEELEKLFEKRGVDNLEAAASTFEGLKRQVAGFGEGLLGLAGNKIIVPLREGLQSIVDVIKEFGPTINHAAEQFGEIVAMVVDFVRTEVFNEVFDPVTIFSFVESLKSGVEWLKNVVAGFLEGARASLAFGKELVGFLSVFSFIVDAIKLVLGGVVALILQVTVLGKVFGILSTRVEEAGGPMKAFKAAMVAGAQGVAIVTAVLNGLIVTIKGAGVALGGMAKALGGLLTGNLTRVKDGLNQANTGIAQLREGGAAAFKKSMLESAESIDEMINPLEEVTEGVKGLDKAMSDASDTAEQKPLLDPAQLEKFGDQLDEAVQNRAKKQAELEQATIEKINKIVADGNEERLSIDKKFDERLAKLAQDSEDKRAQVIDDTRQELADLEKSTDQQIASRRSEFDKNELRQTEDHLKAMRRLQEDFLFNLDDAVRDRDAGAIVDLQRQFKRESSQREEDFSIGQSRQGQDFSEELAGIRENEASRREELLTAQATELDNITKFEEEKRLDIETRRAEEQEKLEINLAETLQRENDNFIARQAALDEALQKQLESIAKNLADQKDVTEEGAREILETFDKFFGIGGDIDKLMEDFARKRKIRADITVAFQGATVSEPAPQTPAEAISSGGAFGGRKRLGGVQEFIGGGTLVAQKPTLALFGETPEVVQFTPMSQLSSPGPSEPGRMIVELTGSAPPGIGRGEVDQIAGVLLQALQDSGALN